MRRRVTFSRNVTLSLSRTCRCFCKYCAFATHRPHLHLPDEVTALLDDAARRRVKELLVLTGEAPDHHPEVRERLGEWGFEDFTAYVVWACQQGLERGLLPHTNLGVLSHEDLARLREVTASQGLMLESVNPDLVAHQGSPTKHPEQRLASIRAAGALRIPFTSGILVGIGESEEDRMASLEALAAVHAEHGHLQEVILQNFVPHRRYYGEEPADIATEAAESFWRTGLSDAPHRDLPAWATPIGIEDMKRLVAEAHRLMPDVGVQVPPNLADWWPELVAAGATDLGGLSANGDHISPEHPFPSPHQVRKRLAPGRRGADRATVRLRALHRPRVGRAGRARRHQDEVLELHPAPRLRAHRGGAAIRFNLVAEAIARGRVGERLTEDELTALFAETRPEAIKNPRPAADELRPSWRQHGDLRRQPQHQRLERLHRGLRILRLRAGQALARRLPARSRRAHASRARGRRLRRHRDLHVVGHPPRLDARRLPLLAAPGQGDRAAASPARLEPDGDRAHVRHLRPCAGRGLRAAARRRPGLDAGHGHRGPARRRARAHRPNKLPVARSVEIIEARHAAGLRSTATVMFGHIEEPWELAEHMRVVRALQERTGGITEFVPLSFIPFHTLLGRTHGVEEISREENLKHTAVFRLALGRTIPSLRPRG